MLRLTVIREKMEESEEYQTNSLKRLVNHSVYDLIIHEASQVAHQELDIDLDGARAAMDIMARLPRHLGA